MRAHLLAAAAVLTLGCGGGVKGSDSARGDTTRPSSSPASLPPAADSGAAPGTGGTTSGASAEAASARSAAGSPEANRSGGKASGSKASTHRSAAAPGSDTIVRSGGADTARGTVAVVGTSFDSHVILRQPGGAPSVTLIGPEARNVGRLGGADVWVTGTRDEAGRITVSRFVVRSVDGQPALDGTLIAKGERLLLVTRDGKQHPIQNPPAALRDHVGARIWVTGSLEAGPVMFGVIEERH